MGNSIAKIVRSLRSLLASRLFKRFHEVEQLDLSARTYGVFPTEKPDRQFGENSHWALAFLLENLTGGAEVGEEVLQTAGTSKGFEARKVDDADGVPSKVIE